MKGLFALIHIASVIAAGFSAWLHISQTHADLCYFIIGGTSIICAIICNYIFGEFVVGAKINAFTAVCGLTQFAFLFGCPIYVMSGVDWLKISVIGAIVMLTMEFFARISNEN